MHWVGGSCSFPLSLVSYQNHYCHYSYLQYSHLLTHLPSVYIYKRFFSSIFPSLFAKSPCSYPSCSEGRRTFGQGPKRSVICCIMNIQEINCLTAAKKSLFGIVATGIGLEAYLKLTHQKLSFAITDNSKTSYALCLAWGVFGWVME